MSQPSDYFDEIDQSARSVKYRLSCEKRITDKKILAWEWEVKLIYFGSNLKWLGIKMADSLMYSKIFIKSHKDDNPLKSNDM